MPHVTFDRAADYYDATRNLAPGVAEHLRDAICALTSAGPGSRFLELGVGTGRIALPFVEAGYDLCGADISRPMMGQLTAKLSVLPEGTRRCRLVQADITALPLASGQFDVAFAVHVLHLVDGWQAALTEARRALRVPGGWLLIVRDDHGLSDETSARQMVNDQWQAILLDLGVDRGALRPGIRAWDGERPDAVLEEYLQGLGARTERVALIEHVEPPVSAREMAQRHIDRLYSSDWLLPDDVHAEAARRLKDWVVASCPDPDRPVSAPARFRAVAARW